MISQGYQTITWCHVMYRPHAPVHAIILIILAPMIYPVWNYYNDCIEAEQASRAKEGEQEIYEEDEGRGKTSKLTLTQP